MAALGLLSLFLLRLLTETSGWREILVKKPEKLIQKLDNLASITVKLPKENIVVPGIYYFIFQRLAWEGIIINEVISTSNEFTILVGEDQVDVAFKVIKDLKN